MSLKQYFFFLLVISNIAGNGHFSLANITRVAIFFLAPTPEP